MIAHEQIHRVVLEHVDQHMRRKKGYAALSDQEKLFMLFKNYRASSPSRGLRLTEYGAGVMQKEFDSWKFEETQPITNRTIITLDNQMQWPYYVSDRKVILFNKEDAAWYQLNGGIDGFMEEL
jgi:hypothetical protein